MFRDIIVTLASGEQVIIRVASETRTEITDREAMRAAYIATYGNQEGEADNPGFDFSPFCHCPAAMAVAAVVGLDGCRA